MTAMAPARGGRDWLGVGLAVGFGLVLALGALGAGIGEVAAQDPDVWWVAAAGRLGSILHPIDTNTFSFTAPEHAWVFHEHLAGPLYAAGLGALGTSFLAALSLVGLLGTAAFVLFTALGWRAPDERERLAGLLLALAWCVAVGLHGMNARVTILARLLPLAFVVLTFDGGSTTTPSGDRESARDVSFGRGRAIVLVVLAWIWANLHGSFPLGVAILALAAIGISGDGRSGDGSDGRTARRRITISRPLLLTSLACALVSFVTPHGLALHGLVADYLTGGADTLAVVHEYVREFQPLWAVDPSTIVPELVALVLVTTIALLGVRSHPTRAWLVLGLVVLATRNQRHLPLALLLAVPLLRPVLAAWLPRGLRTPTRPVAVLALAPALVLGLVAFVRSPAPPPRGGESFDALVARLPEGARVYAPVDVGGRLAWAAFPHARVFADPRNDCYPADVLREAYELGRPGQDREWILEVLARRRVTHVLDRAGTDVARALDDWTFLAREGEWVLLAAPVGLARR
ncbi:MAG: hypothetical protein MUE69_11360 [Myxococcota bacterium]|jgi:hypothetical protein|nr:hypothetical protein [Myxococcota bacterium]